MLRAVLAADARRILDEHKFSCDRVVSVDRDSILYLNGMKRPRTAWLHQPPYGPLRVTIVPGFAPDPPEDWHEQRENELLRSAG